MAGSGSESSDSLSAADVGQGATADFEPARTDDLLIQQFRLQVISGPDAGRTHLSAGPRVVVGTHESATFLLRDPTVSRFHCELMVKEGRALIRDLESRNGTFVDGVSVLAAHLNPGAVLTLGSTQMRFEMADEQVRVPLSSAERFERLVGRSKGMRAVFALLERAAQNDFTVLVQGETGTGKEITAESIHNASRRSEGPFVVLDCGAVPPDLLESELFGHEKGAFTGAVSARQGAFKRASGGTIFLDEIGELRADLQPKLLRALERSEVKPVGSDHYQQVDVRVIAATNRNLQAEVNIGRFRSDLYYRLAVLVVQLPPLRERADDLPLLVANILATLNASEAPEASRFAQMDFLAHLRRHPWPGNVRELRNYIERSLALQDPTPPQLLVGPDAPGVASSPPGALEPLPLRVAREHFERQYLEELLRAHEGNVAAAARTAQVDRAFFYKLLRRAGLR